TAKTLVPAPHVYPGNKQVELRTVFFGTSTQSAEEALEKMAHKGIMMDALRLKAFPFNEQVEDFIASHQTVFVIEQNRDAQMRGLLILELQTDPAKLVPVLNYNGMPITAHDIISRISQHLTQINSQQHDLPATFI